MCPAFRVTAPKGHRRALSKWCCVQHAACMRVSPKGELHDVSDDDLYSFCTDRGLHYGNMVDHIKRTGSDQKNDGWRLIERLRAIGHVDRPTEHVLALGTPEAFHMDCLKSNDGRAVLTDAKNLGKLTGSSYKGGKPWSWKHWECRQLTTAQKRQLLEGRHGSSAAALQQHSPPGGGSEMQLRNAVATPGFDAWRTLSSSPSLTGSLEVMFRVQIISSSAQSRRS